jgi:hypothetical protein
MLELKLQEDQLKSALKALGPSSDKPSFWASSEKVFSLVQTLMVAAAALWALSISISFDRDEKELTQKQQELAFQQQQKLADLDIERARLTNAQAEFTLAQGVRETREGRITGSAKLSLMPRSRPQTTDATFSLRLANTSKAPIQISWILLHWFLGHQREGWSGGILRVNPPPIPYTGQANDGPFLWRQVNYKGYLYPGTPVSNSLAKLECWSYNEGTVIKTRAPCWVFEQGGPTKNLLPGDSAGFEESFEIRAGRDEWVGFVATVGVDDGYYGDSLFKYVRYWQPAASKTTCTDERDQIVRGPS